MKAWVTLKWFLGELNSQMLEATKGKANVFLLPLCNFYSLKKKAPFSEGLGTRVELQWTVLNWSKLKFISKIQKTNLILSHLDSVFAWGNS